MIDDLLLNANVYFFREYRGAFIYVDGEIIAVNQDTLWIIENIDRIKKSKYIPSKIMDHILFLEKCRVFVRRG
jgi:hypothetical protein